METFPARPALGSRPGHPCPHGDRHPDRYGAVSVRNSPSTPALVREVDNLEVEWRQIIGIIQPGNKVGSGTGQVAGGGQPWTPPAAVRTWTWQPADCSSSARLRPGGRECDWYTG